MPRADHPGLRKAERRARAEAKRRERRGAIGRGDATTVISALELPAVAGLSTTGADMLRGAWAKVAAPTELERLEVLDRTAKAVTETGERLLRRFREAYDHALLDSLEAQHKAA